MKNAALSTECTFAHKYVFPDRMDVERPPYTLYNFNHQKIRHERQAALCGAKENGL